jgi:hypothetical protein
MLGLAGPPAARSAGRGGRCAARARWQAAHPAGSSWRPRRGGGPAPQAAHLPVDVVHVGAGLAEVAQLLAVVSHLHCSRRPEGAAVRCRAPRRSDPKPAAASRSAASPEEARTQEHVGACGAVGDHLARSLLSNGAPGASSYRASSLRPCSARPRAAESASGGGRGACSVRRSGRGRPRSGCG